MTKIQAGKKKTGNRNRPTGVLDSKLKEKDFKCDKFVQNMERKYKEDENREFHQKNA